MKFYKRNPMIDSVTVQGKKMGKETVVCGEEFAPFANSNTFPGLIPKLIEVSLESLTSAQQMEARGVAEAQANKPPRHLGVIMSDNMGRQKDGKIRLSDIPDVSFEEKRMRTGSVIQPGLKGSEKRKQVTEEAIKEAFDQGLPNLAVMYSPESLAETLPGVTTKNAKMVLSSFLSLDEMITASNSELRKVGIRANFFDRFRKKAAHERNSFEKKNG